MRTKKALGLVLPKLRTRTRKTKTTKRFIKRYQQYGGDKPNVNSLKYINVFDYENMEHNQCNKFLNPMYGFLWSLYLLDNFILYTNYDIVQLMNMLFVNINSEIVPSKSIESLNLTSKNIGLLLGYCYLYKNNKINNLDEIEFDDTNRENLENLETLLKEFKKKIQKLGAKNKYSFVGYSSSKFSKGTTSYVISEPRGLNFPFLMYSLLTVKATTSYSLSLVR